MLLPVLGNEAYGSPWAYDTVIKSVNQWHTQIGGRGLVLPIPRSSNWLGTDRAFPGQLLRTLVNVPPAAAEETADEKDERLRPTRDHIVMAVTRLLDPSPALRGCLFHIRRPT